VSESPALEPDLGAPEPSGVTDLERSAEPSGVSDLDRPAELSGVTESPGAAPARAEPPGAAPAPPGTGSVPTSSPGIPTPATLPTTPVGMAAPESSPTSADPRVDDALSRLAEVDALPLPEQVEVYADIHRRLAGVLSDPDSQA
jgi:hypothetical protein